MLGFKTFIFGLFIWLSFASPLDLNGQTSAFESQDEITISSYDTNHHALLVDNNHDSSRSTWSIKTFKLASNYLNDEIRFPKAGAYDSRLLYLEISENIPLQLTPRTIIFPFHFFT